MLPRFYFSDLIHSTARQPTALFTDHQATNLFAQTHPRNLKRSNKTEKMANHGR